MPLVRPAVVLSTLALVGLTALPAAQADSTVVVHGPAGFPDGSTQGTVTYSCAHPGEQPDIGLEPTFIQRGPDPVPLGSRTWGYDATHADAADGPYRSVDSIGDLAPSSLQVYAENPTDGITWLMARSGDDTVWFGNHQVSVPAKAWTTISQDTSTSYEWVARHNDGTATGDTFTGTIGELITHVGGGPLPGDIGFGLGCNAAGRYYLDDFEAGTTGDVITFDFEGIRTRTRISGSGHEIRAGQVVTLKGVTQPRPNGFFTDAELVLEAKAFDAPRWRRVGTATETWDGVIHPAVLRVRPLERTAYRWHWRETRGTDASFSPSYVVRVHTAVSAHPVYAHLRRGEQVVVVGRVLPDKRGRTVHLWRGDRRLDAATVRSDGTYTLRATARSAGTWRLHVTIGRTPGNLAGHSRTVEVTVRR